MELLDLARSPVATVEPQQTLGDAARRMQDDNVGAVVVVEQKKVVGILTDRDLAIALGTNRATSSTLVRDVMTADVKTIWADQGIFNATQYLMGHQVRRLPIVNRQDELVGMLAVDDLLALFARELFNVARALEPSLGNKI